MTKEFLNQLDQMVNNIEKMPHDTLQEIEDKNSAAHTALKFIVNTLPDLQVDGIHYQTLESIMEKMDDKIERFESIS